VQVCNEKLLGEIIMEVSRASLKRSRRAVRSEAWRVKRKVCTIAAKSRRYFTAWYRGTLTPNPLGGTHVWEFFKNLHLLQNFLSEIQTDLDPRLRNVEGEIGRS